MDDEDITRQQEIHNAIEEALHNLGDLEPDQILTSWIICFEATSMGSSTSHAGHIYGPSEMTTWRALGLLEWVRRFSLLPDEEE